MAQAGVAGSTTLGRNVVLGASAGVSGHLHLDDGVMVAAMGGVHNNQPKGAVIGGVPAIDVKTWGRASCSVQPPTGDGKGNSTTAPRGGQFDNQAAGRRKE